MTIARAHNVNQHRLLSRFAIWNILGAAAMLGVVKAGYFTLIWSADAGRLTFWSVISICVVFVVGLALAKQGEDLLEATLALQPRRRRLVLVVLVVAGVLDGRIADLDHLVEDLLVDVGETEVSHDRSP